MRSRRRYFILFGGQGSDWMTELRGYWKNPALRSVIDIGLRAIDEELEYFAGSVALPSGFDARRWLDDPSTVPSDDYLTISAVSVPLIFLTQLAAMKNLELAGLPMRELLENTRGIAGHSQGLFTSALIALARHGAEFEEAYSQFTKYVFYLGARSQETHPFVWPTSEEIERTNRASDRAQTPNPLAAVLGGDHRDVEAMVSSFNQRLPREKRIHVSLYNAPGNRILASYRSSLVAFHEATTAAFMSRSLKLIYVRSTCPFHSPLMEPIRPRVEADIARIGFGYAGDDVAIPVYSFFDGRNLQRDDEISIKMYLDILINPLRYELALRPIVEDEEITHVIDFGPGSESQRLNRRVLEGLGFTKPVLSACVPADRETLAAA